MSDPRPLRMVKLFLLGPMMREMEMTLENVPIANSGVTLLEMVPTAHFFRLGDPLLEKGKAILLERGRGGYERWSEQEWAACGWPWKQGWGGDVFGLPERCQGRQTWKGRWESILGEP